MTAGLAEGLAAPAAVEVQVSQARCPMCVVTLSLDDDQPKTGTAHWAIVQRGGIRIGTADSFQCPNGHGSEEDPELLKAFPSRRF